MDKQLFDDAIGEVPPSTIDVDAAIARGRRAAWTHWVANPVTAVAAGVVLVAGGAVALTLPGGNSADPVTAGQVQPTSTTTQVEPSDPPGDQSCGDPGGATKARLTEALSAALRSRGLLTDATLTVDPSVAELEGPGTTPFQFLDHYGIAVSGCMGYSATAVVNGTGRVTVSVAAPGGGLVPEVECLPEMRDCQQKGGPSGEQVLAFYYDDSANAAHVVKSDTVVVLSAENHRGGTAPPLTREQLTEVGLDPGLTLSQ
jgi:hypothetical protein